MKNMRKLSKYFIAFLAIAFVFLAIGLGTLGSVATTGKSYCLMTPTNENEDPNVIFRLTNPKDEEEKTVYCSLTHVYLNVGTLYAEAGKDVQIRINRGASSGSFSPSSSYRYTATLENFLPDQDRSEKTTAIKDSHYNWIDPFYGNLVTNTVHGYKISSWAYYKLTAPTHNLVVNEILFVGEVLRVKNSDGTFGNISSAGEPSGELRILPAQIVSATPYNGQSADDAKKDAEALIDSQRMPNLAQSTFNRFTKEEVYSLMTAHEMKQGGTYLEGSVFPGDTVYNSLGTSLVTFGTVIFGMSPFGLRFFPMLASFGVLVLGYFLARDFFKSEKAGLAFAILYALCNLSIGIGHLGTPLMLGVFFLIGSVYGCYLFFRKGMKKANFKCVLPLVFSGICGAAAICVNGAFLIPMLGVCALFGLGYLRQQRARRHYLDLAIETLEAEGETEINQTAPTNNQAQPEEKKQTEAQKKVVTVASEYRRKNTLAPVAFFSSLVIGAIFLSLIFLIPTYYLAVKLFDDPAAPSLNLFVLGAKLFAGGFVGANVGGNVWFPAYTTFIGSGNTFAITSATVNIFAAVAGLLGIVYAVWRLIKICGEGSDFYNRTEFWNAVIPLAGIVICILTASFAKGALAFLFIAYLFAFLLAADAVRYFTEQQGKTGAVAKAVCITGIILLAVWFCLCAVFTFSIPLPASFMKVFL